MNSEHPADCGSCYSAAVIEVFEELEKRMAAWAQVQPLTPLDVNRMARSAERVIQRGALIGSAWGPEE